MKAIILAAGYGNRMRPLTDQTHKTLLSVGEKTILSRIIDGLLENDITDIIIGTGFRAEEIQEYLRKTYPDIPFSYVLNERYRETNNIFSLALAFDSIDITSDVIVIESDLIYDPSVITQLLQSPYNNVALVDKFRSGMDGTVVTVDSSNVITSVIPPHLQDENFSFSDKYKTLNIYKFSEEFCKTSFKKLLSYYANVIDDNCYYELILGILIYMQKEVIHAGIVKNEWAEVDDPNDLAVAEFIFNKDRKRILEERFGGFWNYDVLDFTFIRNMYFPDSSIISEMKNNLANLIHNYGSKQIILNRKMAWFLLCKEERVIALNGASQIYPILQQRFSGQKVLVPKPTFGEYTRIFHDVDFYYDEVGINLDEITEKMNNCEIVVIVNPNNPTGTTVSTEWIHETASSSPEKTFIIDESFIEFSDNVSIISVLEEKPLDNIVVVKSLSKSLGIPGVRLGYSYSCNNDLNAFIHERIPIWNMNSLAEFMLEIILKHRKALQWSFEETVRDRKVFISDLSKLEIIDCAYKSGGNFILVRLKEGLDCELVVERMLKEHSIYIKNVSGKFESGGKYLRMAVRLPEENRLLVDKLGKISVE
jgi:histidinol-phosphate/aromatic aminotransferase/cobyric acid decarboxylase-like protein/CTP:phosphocholine cytidylyltransferase-like protein